MKLLITGATGTIGGGVLHQALTHPSITSVTALTRRPLETSHPKLHNIIVSDWQHWSAFDLSQISDADAMVWALGVHAADETANYVYPRAFQEQFLEARRARFGAEVEAREGFRHVYVSGQFVEVDQERSLWFLAAARKLRGRMQEEVMAFAERNADVWQAWAVRPGGVMVGDGVLNSVARGVFGTSVITDKQLGAFVVDLVVRGQDEERVIGNKRMVLEGRALLADQSK
ncbi:hypothetical protein EJ04DRAFT_517208 [Polyplosphaeria fusca]|uniref:NAD(P)-binding domain-containing protein n=1 Tax=Polyplosphaeria fusca TaxID=682080 RepID=A0A9P4QHR8_9PLEO|nr:hypothetical protein EJ04DRAFT_517208 [Polyplosphaeria fusca]